MKKIISIFILIAVLFTLSGCNFIDSDMSGLIQAPKISDKRKQLQSALDAAIGKNVKFVFPISGSYKSSIIQKDIDGDEKDEAVVLYLSEKVKKTARIIVLKETDGKWASVCDIEGNGSDIDIMDFYDFDNDGKAEIITGWQLFESKGKGLSVYNIFGEGGVKEIYSTPYTETFLIKNAVGTASAIFTVNLDTHILTSTAKISMYDGKTIKDISTCATDGNLTSHKQVFEDFISDDKQGIIIDGEANGLYSTQILFWDGASLTNPYFENGKTNDMLTRYSPELCTDIDKDGKIEIPRSSDLPALPTLSNASSVVPALVTWNEWDSEKILKYNFSCIMNNLHRYYFVFQPDWNGKVTVEQNSATGDILFYLLGSGEEQNELLFSISALALADWNQRNEQGGWTELKREGTRVFAANIPKTASDKAKEFLKPINLAKNFILISTG